MNVEKISAITLKVRDRQESVRFYMNILGLKAIYAMGAILELRERGKTFGGPEPEHFVFPTCEGYTRPDPTK